MCISVLMTTVAPCAEKGRLLGEYLRRVNECSDAALNLNKEIGCSPASFQLLKVIGDSAKAATMLAATIELEKVTQEMEDIMGDAFPKVVNEAYAACEKALMDLYRHRAKHGC
jgi:hypothetical protein